MKGVFVMSESGFVYVLINPSMEGLIKIGKTTKEPKERAAELSKATGVPTPFVVAYEEYFADCGQAEVFVHTYLEHQGYRVASNREFFEVPMKVAIDAIMECKRSYKDSHNHEITIGSNEDTNLSESLYWHGEDYYVGYGNNVQDYYEAFKLFKQAAKLGWNDAYIRLGQMYTKGDGCEKSTYLALENFKEAIKRGCNKAYADMAFFYLNEGHVDNFRKCWNKYMEELAPYTDDFEMYGYFYFKYAYYGKIKLNKDEDLYFGNVNMSSKEDKGGSMLQDILIDKCLTMMKYYEEKNDKDSLKEEEKFFDYLGRVLRL